MHWQTDPQTEMFGLCSTDQTCLEVSPYVDYDYDPKDRREITFSFEVAYSREEFLNRLRFSDKIMAIFARIAGVDVDKVVISLQNDDRRRLLSASVTADAAIIVPKDKADNAASKLTEENINRAAEGAGLKKVTLVSEATVHEITQNQASSSSTLHASALLLGCSLLLLTIF